MRHLLLLLTLVLFAVGLQTEPVTASQDKWRQRLGRRGDVDQLFKTVLKAGQDKDLEAALPLLEMGLEIPHPHIAVAVGDALSQIGVAPLKDKDFKKRLKRSRKHKDLNVQKNAARILAAWGAPEIDEELAHYAAGRRNPEVQAEALFNCASLKVEDPEKTFPKVVAAVRSSVKKNRTEEIRCAACSAAGELGLRDTSEKLITFVTRSKDDYTGLYAVWALKRMGFVGGLSQVMHAMKSGPKRQTMQACLKAVTELTGLQHVDDLLTLSRSSKKDIRDAACLALARMAWRAQRGLLPADAGPKAPTVTGEESAPDPFKKHKLPNPHLDIPQKVIDRMLAIVEDDDDWEVRDAARQALINFGERAKASVLEAMPGLISNGNDDVATTATELCGVFGAKEQQGALRKIAVYSDEPVRRMFAARALEGCEPEAAIEELLQAAQPSRRTRDHEIHSVRALGYIRHRAAFDGLVKMFEAVDDKGNFEHNEQMLSEAEFALERLTAHRFGRKPDRWKKWIETAENPLFPSVEKFDRSKNREAVKRGGLYGLSPATEKAVEGGLRWLERWQEPLGSWDGADNNFQGTPNCQPAYTGLAELAFLGAGYQSLSGKYRETIRRGIEFLCATQFYDGGYPVTGGGDQSWIYAYLIAMAVWGINEAYAFSADPVLAEPAQWGIDYLVRVQTPGAGWRYGPRYQQSDTSCTSWVMMTVKTADLASLQVAQRCYDGIDAWLQKCSLDVTGEEEVPKDLASDFDFEVGARRHIIAFAGYLPLDGSTTTAQQQASMTAVTMVCRSFQGWKRSHPFMIGCANYLKTLLPQWMKGLNKGMNIAWYHYYWYYGTLGMHQMGGRFWRAWNERIKRMYPEKQRRSPPELDGSWDPDTAVASGGRVFSTAMSILSLETYYRFSPHMNAGRDDKEGDEK